MDIVCQYCQNRAKLVTGRVIYPTCHHLYDKYFWHCDPCGAYVGCHKNSPNHAPLGVLANKQLRMWKNNAHTVFDPLWKGGEMQRIEAYCWLAEQLGLPIEETHIGMFDIATCKRVIDVVRKKIGWVLDESTQVLES